MLLFRYIFLIATLMLNSCGFSPLYKKLDNQDMVHEFAAIQINVANSDIEKDFTRTLGNLLNPLRISEEHKYILDITLIKSISSSAIQKTSEVGRRNVILNVNFVLKKIKSMEIIETGYLSMSSSYGEVPSEFASFVAEEYSIENNIREASGELHSRLGVILSNLANENKSE